LSRRRGGSNKKSYFLRMLGGHSVVGKARCSFSISALPEPL
jgi:hypothetical protein